MNDDPPPIDCDVDFERPGRQVSWLRLLHSDDRHAYGVVPIPIAVLANREGPTLLLGAGTHGDEYEGQIILGRLIRELDLDALHGRLIIFPALNYPAVRAGTRVSPLDGGNLNRSFPGEGGGPPTRAIADYVTREVLPRCDAGIDLHSGGSTTEFLPCAFLCTPPERALASRMFELVEAFGAPGSATAPGALSEVPGRGAATSLPARPGPIPGGPVVSRWCYAASRERAAVNENPERFAGYRQAREPRRGPDEALVRAGPGTPGGEYLRRFWHPVARTAQVGDLPLALRRFGEDLVLFRDRGGRFGLVHRHCPHRNASLEFGIIQPRGIRCCYHGWHFDVDGALLDAPAEPESVRLDQRVRLGAYPVREYRGLVFAYLGPPEEQPPFPRFDTCEIEGGELLPYEVPMDCNWLQIAENSMDPMHVVFLHTRVNRVQFSKKLGILPVLRWFERPIGFFYTKGRRMGDFVWIATNDVVLPNFTQAGAVFESTDGKSPKYFGRNSFTRWIVPVDDTHATVLAFRHFNRRAEGSREEWRTPEALEQIDITRLRNRPYRERQRDPGDYEAIAGQGPITPHGREHLASSDIGVVRYRRRLRAEIDNLKEGRAPLQPAAHRSNPVPTYGSDTVIRMPADPEVDDEQAIGGLLSRVGEIYQSADHLQGEARYEDLALKLAALNR